MEACWTSGAGSLERLGPRGLRRHAATSSSQRQGALLARQGLGFRVYDLGLLVRHKKSERLRVPGFWTSQIIAHLTTDC